MTTTSRAVCLNRISMNQMKKLNRKGKIMVLVNRHPFVTGIVISLFLWAGIIFAVTKALAAECPNPGEKCKVIYLSEQEERVLTGQNGILDTAAQARALDLGQFAVYLKTRIGSAPAGEVKAVPTPEKPASEQK